MSGAQDPMEEYHGIAAQRCSPVSSKRSDFAGDSFS
jgi:hypothetical protein